MTFLKEHYLSVFSILAIVFICKVIYTQFKFKKKGKQIDAEIIGYNNGSNNPFAVYKFTYEGEELKIDAHFADKKPAPVGTVEKIYYIPGNKQGVMRERDLSIKLWQIGCIVAFAALMAADLFLRK